VVEPKATAEKIRKPTATAAAEGSFYKQTKF
jgi:hypothetical protein